MIKETQEAIITQYNTLTLNGSALSAICPVYADVAGVDEYPFSVFYLQTNDVEWNTCSNIFDLNVMISTFHNNSLLYLSEIADVIYDGFNGTTLTGMVTAKALRILPAEIGRIRNDENTGYIIDNEFSLLVEDSR
jgi:hypothetical protein